MKLRTSSTAMNSIILLVLAYLQYVCANVEKIVFTSPSAEPLPRDASFDNLLLLSVSEKFPTVRTHLGASFPNTTSPKGTAHWFFLEGLRPHNRYEVRICWLATQPTSFSLRAFEVNVVFQDPDLLQSLSEYSYSRHAKLSSADAELLQQHKATPDSDTTFVFLRVYAAADYYSLDDSLMVNVPPVAVDIILDRYILDFFPRSLLSTGLYLMLVAVGAWFLSGWISRVCTAPLTRAEARKSPN